MYSVGTCIYMYTCPFLCAFCYHAGKSTVAALLERFYDPQVGEICIDGHSLCSLDPSWVRGTVIGYINQEPILFATTILENIRYGNQSASDEQVQCIHTYAHSTVYVPPEHALHK